TDADFTAGSGVTVPFSDLDKGWEDGSFNVGGVSGSFDPSQIGQVSMEITSGNTGPWTNPTIVYVDSIRTAHMRVDDTFDTNMAGMVKSTTQVVAGSTLTWYDSLP